MFYDKYLKLCNEKNIKPTTAAVAMGFSSAAVARWKAGSTPTDATLLVIANYFGVSMADLLPDEEIVRRELSQYPPAGMEHVAEEERKKHEEEFGKSMNGKRIAVFDASGKPVIKDYDTYMKERSFFSPAAFNVYMGVIRRSKVHDYDRGLI